MKDYTEKTKKIIQELMADLVSKRAIFVKEIEVDWKTEKVTNAGENVVDSSELMTTILVPKVTVKCS